MAKTLVSSGAFVIRSGDIFWIDVGIGVIVEFAFAAKERIARERILVDIGCVNVAGSVTSSVVGLNAPDGQKYEIEAIAVMGPEVLKHAAVTYSVTTG